MVRLGNHVEKVVVNAEPPNAVIFLDEVKSRGLQAGLLST